jgi:tetratricopeptide (TPR) repeat protein
MPRRKIPVEMLKTICFAIQVLKSPDREFKDNDVDVRETLKKIETLLAEQEIQQAINCYEKLLLIEPYNGDFLNNIAWLHYELGLLNQALLFSKKAVKISPTDKDYLDTFAKIKSALKSTSSFLD